MAFLFSVIDDCGRSIASGQDELLTRSAKIVVCVGLATVFTKLTRFEVAGWESLKPYTIGIIRGIKFAERHTKRMNAVAVKDYVALAPRISAVFEEMRASGELARLRDHVIVVLLNLAEKGMPLCDDDYACFETPPD